MTERFKVLSHKSGHGGYVESIEKVVAAIDDRPIILYAPTLNGFSER